MGFLFVLNAGLYLVLTPNLIPRQQPTLPYWDLLERPNLDWLSLGKNPELETGQWRATQYQQAQLPISLLPNEHYQISAEIKPSYNGVFELWFNTQQMLQFRKTQMVKVEVYPNGIALTAWVYNRFAVAQILERAEIALTTTINLEIFVAIRHFAVYVNQKYLFSAPLQYLGGIPGIGIEKMVLEEIRVQATHVKIPKPQPWFGLESTAWQAIRGTWRVNHGLEQLDTRAFDQFAVYQKKIPALQELDLELKGVGAGLVFAMPEAKNLALAFMVRLSNDGHSIFWGYFNQQNIFIGRGYQKIKPAVQHKLKLRFLKQKYALYLDKQLLVNNIAFTPRAGFVALTTSQSSAKFLQFQVNQQSVLPQEGKKSTLLQEGKK